MFGAIWADKLLLHGEWDHVGGGQVRHTGRHWFKSWVKHGLCLHKYLVISSVRKANSTYNYVNKVIPMKKYEK